MTEEWRPIPGYEGLYEVSDQGRVRSLERFIERAASRGARTTHMRRFPARILKPWEMKRGAYLAVSLWRDNRGAPCPIHVLVAAAFHGPRPDGLQVRHLDGNEKNNVPANLAYGTALENADDLRRHGNHHNTRKTHCPSGHPYDEENTYVGPRGGRWCNACRRARNRVVAA